MKIVRTTARGFRLPLRERMVSSRVTMTHRELVLVEIETDAGLTGTRLVHDRGRRRHGRPRR